MIDWLVQSMADLPALPAEAWLSPPERERLATLRVEKKRGEWLLGRWTAKRLVQAVWLRDGLGRLELLEIVIIPAADGAPQLHIARRPAGESAVLISRGGGAGEPGATGSGGAAGESATLNSRSGGVGEPGATGSGGTAGEFAALISRGGGAGEPGAAGSGGAAGESAALISRSGGVGEPGATGSGGAAGESAALISRCGGVGEPGATGSGGAAGESAALISRSGGVGEPGSPTLSISHSGGLAFCAVGRAAVGADIETVAPRGPAFAADYFTPAEQALVAAAPAELRDTLVTAIWSAKESVLKALRLGLTVDTRLVECPLGLGPGGAAPADWAPFTARCHPSLGGPPAGLRCWWRRHKHAVLSLAAAM